MRRAALVLALVLVALAIRARLRHTPEHPGQPTRIDAAASVTVSSSALDGAAIDTTSQRESSADTSSRTAAREHDGASLVEHDGTGEVHVRVLPCSGVSTPLAFSGVLVPWSAADPELSARAFETSDDGTSVIASLAPGPFTLTLALGGHVEGVVHAGATTSVVVDASAGFPVRGVVVDASGAPVSAADVWLSRFVDVSEAEIVATSAADGRFALPCVLGGGYLVARARGHAPSPRTWVLGSAGRVSQFRLVVGNSGATLAVGVRDPSGAPVVSARIEVADSETNADASTPGGGMPAFARTDARGEAVIDGLVRAPATVRVTAMGFAPWTGPIEPPTESTSRLEVVMEWGVRVHGLVQDAGSTPVAGARVTARSSGDAHVQRVVASTDGRFELANLRAGEILLDVESEQSGAAATTLRAAPGDELHHVVRLVRGRTLRGKITDLGDRPLVQWRIEVGAGSPERTWRAETSTLPDGTFAIEDAPSDRVTVHVRGARTQSPRPEQELPLTTLLDVAPGREVELRLAPPSAFLDLAFEPDGLERAAARVRVQQVASGVDALFAVPASGEVLRIGPIASGSYRVRVESRDSSVAPIDLGEQTLVDGGTVLLQRVRIPR